MTRRSPASRAAARDSPLLGEGQTLAGEDEAESVLPAVAGARRSQAAASDDDDGFQFDGRDRLRRCRSPRRRRSTRSCRPTDGEPAAWSTAVVAARPTEVHVQPREENEREEDGRPGGDHGDPLPRLRRARASREHGHRRAFSRARGERGRSAASERSTASESRAASWRRARSQPVCCAAELLQRPRRAGVDVDGRRPVHPQDAGRRDRDILPSGSSSRSPAEADVEPPWTRYQADDTVKWPRFPWSKTRPKPRDRDEDGSCRLQPTCRDPPRVVVRLDEVADAAQRDILDDLRDLREAEAALEERRDRNVVRRVERARRGTTALPAQRASATTRNASSSTRSNASVKLEVEQRLDGCWLRDRHPHVGKADVRRRAWRRRASAWTTDVGCTTTSILSYGTPKSQCASISSDLLRRRRVDRDLRPIDHVGWRSASSWLVEKFRVRPRNGPPEAVRTTPATVSGGRPSRRWWSAGVLAPAPGRRPRALGGDEALLVCERERPTRAPSTCNTANPTTAFGTMSADAPLEERHEVAAELHVLDVVSMRSAQRARSGWAGRPPSPGGRDRAVTPGAPTSTAPTPSRLRQRESHRPRGGRPVEDAAVPTRMLPETLTPST